jgi:CheY-like chemotaxis protein/HPt (histidine-containing phosphotransfer) domain-containing protein
LTPPLPLRVLVVEDNPGDARLVELSLAPLRGYGVRWVTVRRLAQAVEHIRKKPVDVVLLDLSLPDSSGTETVGRVRRAGPKVPIVVLSASLGSELERELLALGATMVLEKGPISRERLLEVLAKSTGRKLGPPFGTVAPGPGAEVTAGPASPQKSSGPIDTAALHEIRKLAGEEDANLLVREVVRAFISQGEQLVAELDSSAGKGQRDGLRRAAHSLRSLCLQVGAVDLARTVAELEAASSATDLTPATALCELAAEQFLEARDALESVLE